MNKIKFSDLNLSKELLKATNELGYEETTPIQFEAIPVMLKGKDIIGQAQTGTGKTAAFGIPLIEMINHREKSLQALILCPTRELAIQVAEEMAKLSKFIKEFSTLPIYGGQSIERQIKALKRGVHVVIGTPGRIIDHLERGTIKLKDIRFVVLDEADEMLDIGFRDAIEEILRTAPAERQTVMFSATVQKGILEISRNHLKNPVTIRVVHEVLTVPGTEQIYFELREKDKVESLTRLLDIHNFKIALVFCNTKKGVDELVEHLRVRGYSAEGLHGDMRQAAREKVIGKFKKGNLEILIATDVAARGLDIDDVEAVFNFDMPQDEDYYVHRIGRTGRMGKKGKAFTFVTGREIFKLKIIQKYTKTKIMLDTIPTFGDVEEVRSNLFLNKIRETIKAGNLNHYLHLAERLINEDYTSLDVAAALLKMSMPDEKQKPGKEIYQKANLPSSGDARLFINVGKKDKVRPGDILGAITGETGLDGKLIGDIDIYDKFSFVNIPAEHADEIIDVMEGVKIKGKKINMELANKEEKVFERKPRR
jgi:ATP-dependent RNA helicase DeaD